MVSELAWLLRGGVPKRLVACVSLIKETTQDGGPTDGL